MHRCMRGVSERVRQGASVVRSFGRSVGRSAGRAAGRGRGGWVCVNQGSSIKRQSTRRARSARNPTGPHALTFGGGALDSSGRVRLTVSARDMHREHFGEKTSGA